MTAKLVPSKRIVVEEISNLAGDRAVAAAEEVVEDTINTLTPKVEVEEAIVAVATRATKITTKADTIMAAVVDVLHKIQAAQETTVSCSINPFWIK